MTQGGRVIADIAVIGKPKHLNPTPIEGRFAEVQAFGRGSARVVPLVLQNEKIFSPSRVEGKMCDCVSRGGEDRIVQLGLQILGIFSKHYLVTRTAGVRWRCHRE
jgi:hypothetical protein